MTKPLQDVRRRIAQDLHDSTSQTLVVLQLGLGRLRREIGPEADRIIEKLEQTIAAMRQIIRDAVREENVP